MNVTISYDSGESNLIDDIKSLEYTSKKKTKKTKFIVDDDNSENILSLAKSKKKKGKKKKKKLIEDDEFLKVDDTDDNEEKDPYTIDNSLIDIDEIFGVDEEDDIDSEIINEQKKGYKKNKSSENEYKKEFAEELTLLYNLLDETTKFGKVLDKQVDGLKSTKTRGMSKYTTDLITTALSCKTNKLQIIKEISSVKKTIADLKIKADGKNKPDANGGGQASAEVLASNYLQGIIKYGRNNFVTNLKKDSEPDTDDPYLAEYLPDKEMLLNNVDYDDLIDDRLDNEDNPFRSEEGSKYIEYENRGVKIIIKYCIDTGDWEFAAVDRDNQQVYDYPLPHREDVGKVKFSDDGRFATDGKGRSYKVIEYYSPD